MKQKIYDADPTRGGKHITEEMKRQVDQVIGHIQEQLGGQSMEVAFSAVMNVLRIGVQHLKADKEAWPRNRTMLNDVFMDLLEEINNAPDHVGPGVRSH